MANTNKVKFKTNKPIMLPVQTKSWGYHEATDMSYEDVFKLLAAGAEDIFMVSSDGTETAITWENLETYFPQTDSDSEAATLEADYVESFEDYMNPPVEEPSFEPVQEPVEIPAGQPIVNVPVDTFVDSESGITFLPVIDNVQSTPDEEPEEDTSDWVEDMPNTEEPVEEPPVQDTDTVEKEVAPEVSETVEDQEDPAVEGDTELSEEVEEV